MKLKTCVFFLLLWCSSLSAQKKLDSQVDLNYQQTTLSEILNYFTDVYGLRFSYGDMDLSVSQDFVFKGALEEALQKLFYNNNIAYKHIADQIVLKYKYIIGKAVKGLVLDSHSKAPLIGATVSVVNALPAIGSETNVEGYFSLKGLRIGRYDFLVQYLGYEPVLVNQVLISAGKEVFLNIDLQESTHALREVLVKVEQAPDKAVSDMATPTGRSFSVEQTQRFAAAISDPARMVQSFAGVSSGGDDISNEIIIRGNSSRGLLWRIEGVEVPNPNHFGGLGAGGGAISMLSAATLSDSDFYTGAFPAEFGNALSGVFDLRLRNGNKDKREHSIVVGNLGLEASTEGYFTKKSNASYLVNYRYSTIELINNFLPALGRQIPAYRDLSFKINVPTSKAGRFSLFGLRGQNTTRVSSSREPESWVNFVDQLDYFERQKLRVWGLGHQYFLSDNSYIKTSLSTSYYRYYDLTELLDLSFKADTIDESIFDNRDYNLSFTFHKKINARQSIRSGFNLVNKHYSFDYVGFEPDSTAQKYILNSGDSYFLQSFLQWRYYLSDNWEMNSGVHFSYLFLNDTYGIDPRFSIKYKFLPKQSISISTGLHSKIEHPSTYFIERIQPSGYQTNPNLSLGMSKAIHLVGGYNWQLAKTTHLKIEAYYQHLYNIPVSEDPSTGFSVLNVGEVFDIVFQNNRSKSVLKSEGLGRNYGLELTLEKTFGDGWYFLFNTSIFESEYAGIDRQWYPTRAANNFLLNLLWGKEWLLGKQDKNVLGLNSKFTYYGGNRDNPIDLEASRAAGDQVTFANSFYSKQLAPYIRFDLGISFKINTANTTHTFLLDMQNITNRFNVFNEFYDIGSESILEETQNGFIPFMSYRFEFGL